MDKEVLFSHTFQFAAIGMALVGLDGKWLKVNPALCELVGYSEEELLTTTFQAITHPEDLEEDLSYIGELVQGNIYAYQMEKRYYHKLGHEIWILLNGTLVRDEQGEPLYLIKQIQDITQRKQAESQLRESEQRYRLLAEHSLDAIVRFSPDFIIHYVSPACQTLFGYEPDELIGKQLTSYLHPEDYEEILSSGSLSIPGGHHRMFRFLKKDGSYLWIESRCKDIYALEKVIETISVFRDVTERKRVEAELLNSELKFRSIIESASDAIILAEQDTKIIAWNKGAEALFGYTEEEAIGEDVDIIIPEHLKEGHRRGVERLRATGESKIIGRMVELSGLRKDGTEFPSEISLNCWKSNGNFYWSAIIRDITERKKTQELLLNSEKLSVAGQLAAGIAHEIRNPLTAIKGFLHLLKKDTAGKPYYFEILSDEMNRIELILNELLLLAKPQAMQFKEVDLRVILEQVSTLLDTQAILHNIEVEVKYEEHVPTSIQCDENQMKQIFINFLKNAMEAMPNGGIIAISVNKYDADSIVVRIVDQGVGIPEDKLERIGEPFYSTKDKGTGLGLMVCRKIIENHHGTLNFSSKPNEGTMVEVTLPMSVDQNP
jgi:two-component system sporulation sensor kinase A